MLCRSTSFTSALISVFVLTSSWYRTLKNCLIKHMIVSTTFWSWFWSFSWLFPNLTPLIWVSNSIYLYLFLSPSCTFGSTLNRFTFSWNWHVLIIDSLATIWNSVYSRLQSRVWYCLFRIYFIWILIFQSLWSLQGFQVAIGSIIIMLDIFFRIDLILIMRRIIEVKLWINWVEIFTLSA